MPHSRKRNAKEHHLTVRAVPRPEPDMHRLAQAIIAIAKVELAARRGTPPNMGPSPRLGPPIVPPAQRDASSPQGVRHTARPEANGLADPDQRQA